MKTLKNSENNFIYNKKILILGVHELLGKGFVSIFNE